MKKVIGISISLFLAQFAFTQSTWHYLPNAPSSVRFEDVFFINSQVGWAVNGQGQAHKTTDGGLTWTQIYFSDFYIRTVEFWNEQLGYMGTLNSRFFRTTDGGASWDNIADSITPKPHAVCGISVVDSLYTYAVGAWNSPGFVLKTTDGGNTWTRQDMSDYATGLVDVFFLSRDTGFVTGIANNGAVILYTTDGGQTWQEKFNSQIPNQYVWKIQRVTKEVWVGSIQTFVGGKFVKSLDGGMTWQILPAPIPDMQGIGFATPEHGWVGGYINGFYETKDGGETWEFKDFGGNFNRFFFLDSTLAYASGWSVFKFSDSTMTDVKPPLQKHEVDGFEVSIAPNPLHDHMTVRFHLPVYDIVRMHILSMDGTLLRSIYHQQLSAGDYQFEADCAHLPKGTYLLGIQRNHGLHTRPFSKL